MRTPVLLAAALGLFACERGGTSSAEMRAAAIDHARQVLGLAADVPLEATVWVGPEQHEGETVLCGTVSGTSPGTRVPPKRFAATGEPVRWLIFEDAHDPMVRTQPDMFSEWQRLCGGDESRL